MLEGATSLAKLPFCVGLGTGKTEIRPMSTEKVIAPLSSLGFFVFMST